MNVLFTRLCPVLIAVGVIGCSKGGDSPTPVAKANAAAKPAAPKANTPDTKSGQGFNQNPGFGDVLGADRPSGPAKTGGGFGSPPTRTGDDDRPEPDADAANLRRVREIVAELEAEKFFVGPFFELTVVAGRKLTAPALKAELQALARRPDPSRHDVNTIITRVAPRYTRREVQDVFQYKLALHEARLKAEPLGPLFKQAYGYDLGNLADVTAFEKVENQYRMRGDAAGLGQVEEFRTTWNGVSSRLSWDWLQNKENLTLLIERIDKVKGGR